MTSIYPIGMPQPLQPERAAQRDEIQVQEEAPRKQADTISLRGRSTFEAPEMMTFEEANALLNRLTAAPQGLAGAHNELDPARVARLLELDLV